MSLLLVTLPGKHMSFGGQKQTVDRLKTFNWRKKSVFFELEYWSSLVLRHNHDVMHVKKNVFDSLFNTILGMDKSKDTDNVKKDLADVKIRPELNLFIQGDKVIKPAEDFTLTPEERHQFYKFIKLVKFPDGFAS